jgi:hypothetical protein
MSLTQEVWTCAKALEGIAARLYSLVEPPGDTPPFDSIVDELPINFEPDHPQFVSRHWVTWPERSTDDIKGITIHHTLSHSPMGTALYCTKPYSESGKGYPSIQYHFWVSQGDGAPAYLCAYLSWALWHDHTGSFPKTISIGLAGSLHHQRPPEQQLESAARLVRWLMKRYKVPLEEVKGHCDRWPTLCPGWDVTGWRDEFYTLTKS